MTIPADHLTIVVRECGERTADACVRLLSGVYPDAVVHRVSARPFHETLRQSLELGIREGRPWTLCIDADVLILPEIAAFLAEAAQLPPNVLGAQALVLDKLIPSRRPAGNHLYRTELIPLALPLIPTSDSLRPETDMIRAMADKGFSFHQSSRLVGLHDYEQSCKDVYMKAFLHGHKHRFLMHLFRPLWEDLSRTDDDYRIALLALDDALRHEEMPQVSRDFREREARDALDKLGIPEKLPFPTVDADCVCNTAGSATSALGEEALRLARGIQSMIDAAMAQLSAQTALEDRAGTRGVFFYTLGMAGDGEDENALRQYSAELAKGGVAVYWITFDPVNVPRQGIPEGVEWVRLSEPALTSPKGRSVFSQASKLAELLEYIRPAQLLCWTDAAFPSAFLAARMTRTPMVPARHTQGEARRRGLPMLCLKGMAFLFSRPRISAKTVFSAFFMAATPARFIRFREEKRKTREAVARIFNAAWYARKYAPALRGEDCLRHYLALGQYLAHDPHPLFWSRWYLDQYLSVAENVQNPWAHYHHFGSALGCNPNPFFHSRWYRSFMGTEKNSNPLLHYIGRPWSMCPDPNPLFDSAWYCSHYPNGDDGMNPLEDFLTANGDRAPHPLFLAHPSMLRDASGNGLDYAEIFGTYLNYRKLAESRRVGGSVQESTEVPHGVVDLDTRPGKGKRYALCSVITGGYDAPRGIMHRDLDVDYFLITDRPTALPQGWDRVVVADVHATDPLRASRYLKMHLLGILPNASDYEAIAYVDGNIRVAGSMAEFFGKFRRSGISLGLVPHPERYCVYQEAAAVILGCRDDRQNVMRATAFLEREGFPENNGLFEMNFFMFRPTPEAAAFFSAWWDAFDRYGNRDQLLAPYVLWKYSMEHFPLLPPGQSVRAHPAFSYEQHSGDNRS